MYFSEKGKAVNLWERNEIQKDNAEKFLSDFDVFKNNLKSLFISVSSNNDDKDLTSKFYDRMSTLLIEKLIVSGYNDVVYNKLNAFKGYGKKAIKLDNLWYNLNSRIHRELCAQYRFLGFLYGQQLGLSDEQIINKSCILNGYGYKDMFSDILNYGKSIEDIVSNFYVENYNMNGFLCVRGTDNILVYPNLYSFPDTFNYNLLDTVLEYKNSFGEKYNPFVGSRVEQLYDEIIKPYYEKIGLDLENEKVASMSVFDDYKSEVSNFNSANFSSKYEYDLTQDLVNEFLSQKENKSNKQL